MYKTKDDAATVIGRLSKFATYDPITGKFICTRTTSGRSVPLGEEVGHIGKTTGYKYISIRGTRYSCHALAWAWMTGDWHTGVIDHINRERTDNRWINLRQTTERVNQFNRKHPGGVGWHKASQKWRAYITINGKAKHLGLFPTKEQAKRVHLKSVYEI